MKYISATASGKSRASRTQQPNHQFGHRNYSGRYQSDCSSRTWATRAGCRNLGRIPTPVLLEAAATLTILINPSGNCVSDALHTTQAFGGE